MMTASSAHQNPNSSECFSSVMSVCVSLFVKHLVYMECCTPDEDDDKVKILQKKPENQCNIP